MFDWLTRVSVVNQILLALLLIDVGLVSWRYRSLPANLKPLLWLVIANLLVESISDYVKVKVDPNNLYVYHFYAPVEYTILSVIFYYTLREPLTQRWVLWSVAGYVIIVIISTLYWEPLTKNNSITYMIESILVICWCSLYFRMLLRAELLYRPEADPVFWVLTALLLYFAGTFFTIGLINYFVAVDKSQASLIYYGSYPFIFILYVTIGVAMLLKFPAQPQPYSDD